MVQWVPYTGGEKESLLASLNRHRDTLVWKLQGLDDTELRRAMLPRATACSTWSNTWPPGSTSGSAGPSGTRPSSFRSMRAMTTVMSNRPWDSTAGILAFYSRSRVAADQVISGVDLDEAGTRMFGDTVSLRWAVIHILEDTSRHAGHIDVMRELIDGMVGDHQRDGSAS